MCEEYIAETAAFRQHVGRNGSPGQYGPLSGNAVAEDAVFIGQRGDLQVVVVMLRVEFPELRAKHVPENVDLQRPAVPVIDSGESGGNQVAALTNVMPQQIDFLERENRRIRKVHDWKLFQPLQARVLIHD